MILNKEAENLKVGDKVTSEYHLADKELIRTITRIDKDTACGSGYRASASAGLCDCCKKCKATFGSSIIAVDAAWFVPKNIDN